MTGPQQTASLAKGTLIVTWKSTEAVIPVYSIKLQPHVQETAESKEGSRK